MATLQTLRGLARSIVTYRLDRNHARGLRRLYAPFVETGDLVFDVGAHVGDRIAAFRALGARVVAVEPQPLLARTLWLLHGLDRNVVIEASALGPKLGKAHLYVNTANPTVSTRSTAFVASADGAPGWEGQVWDRELTVPADTLDGLRDRHGEPRFVKIDVEGFEAEVLAGLSVPPPALSFEIVTAHLSGAQATLARAQALGYLHFRLSLSESHAWATPWCDGQAMAATLEALPADANSGDVYAVMARHPALAC